MPRCPFCNKEIRKLVCYSLEWLRHEMELTDDGVAYGEVDFMDVERVEYLCPECDKDLGLRYGDEAEAFLMGQLEVIPKEKAKVKGDYAVYNGKIYRIEREEEVEKGKVLIAREFKDEPEASIMVVSL